MPVVLSGLGILSPCGCSTPQKQLYSTISDGESTIDTASTAKSRTERLEVRERENPPNDISFQPGHHGVIKLGLSQLRGRQ